MKSMKCFTYASYVVVVLVTLCPAQTTRPSQAAQTQLRQTQATIDSFAAWAIQYAANASQVSDQQTLSEGLALARERRAVLEELIKREPALVLAASVPASVRNLLPDQILAELESPVSGTGDLLVLCAMSAQGSHETEPLQRRVRLDGRMYRAVVYGRRLSQTTKFGIPLHGTVLNGVLVLHEKVLFDIEREEAFSPTNSVMDLTAAAGPLAGSGPAVLARMSGKVYRFASPEHLRHSEALLEAAETGMLAQVAEPAAALLEHMRFPEAEVKTARRPRVALPGGPLQTRVLVIRVDFSDLPGDPRTVFGAGSSYTASSVQDVIDTQITPYYQKSSYGRASLEFTVAPQLYRVPGTASYYATTGYEFQLYGDAIAAAQDDYPANNYDKIIVLFSWLGNIPGSQLRFGGLSLIGSSKVWVNGEFDFRIVAHELGHTLGLSHANFWQANGNDPTTDNGNSVEYGDPFDTMSGNWGNDRRVDFNPWFKYLLNWIHDDQVQTVTENGLYRVYRFDDPGATGALALRITRDAERDYWIGFRRNFAENAGLQRGAYVVWGYGEPTQSNLLGLGSAINTPRDPGLLVGTALADSEANLTVLPVDSGGEAPNEYLDVQITFGPPRPLLRMNCVAGRIVLTWPALATGYVLEMCTDLSAGSWAAVDHEPAVVGRNCVFTNESSSSLAFLRLHRK